MCLVHGANPAQLFTSLESCVMWSAVAKLPLFSPACEACRSQDGEINFTGDKAEVGASAVQSQVKAPDKNTSSGDSG